MWHESRRFFYRNRADSDSNHLWITEWPETGEKIAQKGIKKYIAYNVPEDLVKERYGKHYNVILGDLKQNDDLRVLDYDGHHVFYSFSLKEMGEPTYHEAE